MSEIRLLFKLAKIIRTPQEAALVLTIAAVIVLLAYAIPPEIKEAEKYID